MKMDHLINIITTYYTALTGHQKTVVDAFAIILLMSFLSLAAKRFNFRTLQKDAEVVLKTTPKKVLSKDKKDVKIGCRINEPTPPKAAKIEPKINETTPHPKENASSFFGDCVNAIADMGLIRAIGLAELTTLCKLYGFVWVCERNYLEACAIFPQAAGLFAQAPVKWADAVDFAKNANAIVLTDAQNVRTECQRNGVMCAGAGDLRRWTNH